MHLVIAETTTRITSEKLKEGLIKCRQIYLNISFPMGIMFVWKIVQ